MCPCAVIYDDLLLGAVPGKNRLLDVVEERHEVLLVGGGRQLHHTAILKTLANRADHCDSHLASITNVEHRLLLLRPALRFHLH